MTQNKSCKQCLPWQWKLLFWLITKIKKPIITPLFGTPSYFQEQMICNVYLKQLTTPYNASSSFTLAQDRQCHCNATFRGLRQKTIEN
jgi:hypothetical protein